MKKFGLIGAAGYIAPRHMQAIKDTENILVAAYDKNDSVGAMDKYFPNANFFTEFERFDRHIDKISRLKNKAINFMSIASPNYLHDAHIRFALRNNADAICEKPLVLNPWNLDSLKEAEIRSGQRVWSILQLRLHPSIQALKSKIDKASDNTKYDLDLTYITSRGKWYLQSWKGDELKSGGIATNIGVHFFDMLGYIFGNLQISKIHLRSPTKSAGYLEFNKARVRWFLSIDSKDLPKSTLNLNTRTYRSISMDGYEIEFSDGFTNLHTESYKNIINGNGFGLMDNLTAIETVHNLRNASIDSLTGDYHPMVKKK